MSIIGKIESILGSVAVVTLINCETDERIESRCDVKNLNGMKEGDEFVVVISKGKAELHHMPHKKLTQERINEIVESFKNRWSF